MNNSGLDFAYHGQRSGDKFIAPYLYGYLNEDTAVLTNLGIANLATAIEARYYQKWKHLWDIFTVEYSPLDTYNVTETATDDGTKTTAGTDTRTPNLTTKDVLDQDDTDRHTNSSSLTHGEQIATQGTENTTNNNNLFGFNSSSAVPTSQPTTATTTSGTETHSGSDSTSSTVSGTNTRDSTNIRTETGTETIQRSGSETDSRQYSRTRKGNMYRSPAELLEFDREFWQEDFFSIVFADMDEMLTLAIYSEQTPRVGVY